MDKIAELDKKFEDFIQDEISNIDCCWHCEHLACIPETRYEPEEWYCELHLESCECPEIKNILVYHFLDSVCEEYDKEILDEWERLENGQ